MPKQQAGLTIFPTFTIAGGVTVADSDTYNPGPSALGFDGANYIAVSCRNQFGKRHRRRVYAALNAGDRSFFRERRGDDNSATLSQRGAALLRAITSC